MSEVIQQPYNILHSQQMNSNYAIMIQEDLC